jgi:hypothetical protein
VSRSYVCRAHQINFTDGKAFILAVGGLVSGTRHQVPDIIGKCNHCLSSIVTMAGLNLYRFHEGKHQADSLPDIFLSNN